MLQHIYEHAIANSGLPYVPLFMIQNQDPFQLLRAGKIDAALIPPGGFNTRIGAQNSRFTTFDRCNECHPSTIGGNLFKRYY